MGINFFRICLTLVLFLLNAADVSAGDRIFWLDSYAPGNPWSDAIGRAIAHVFEKEDVEFAVFHMNAKQHNTEVQLKGIANRAVNEINLFKPKVVIASDDDASKYVVMQFFKDAELPFVFCGVNHNGARYGYPYKNATGIVELDPVEKLIYSLSRFKPITRIGYLAENSTSARLNGETYKEQARITCRDYFVDTFEEWKAAFRHSQEEVDALIIGNTSAIKSWDEKIAELFVIENTSIPTGCLLEFLANLSLIGCIKVPEEQGRWAAESALAILNGKSPASISITVPREHKLILNLKIAKAIGIDIPKSYIDKANTIIQ